MKRFKVRGSYYQPISIIVEAESAEEAHNKAREADNWEENDQECDVHWEHESVEEIVE